MSENKPISCPNCGTDISEEMKFCPSCGKALGESNELPTTRDFFKEFINYDPAIWTTLKQLIIHPGTLTRKFIQGDHKEVTSPAKLFILISALAFFIGVVNVTGEAENNPDTSEETTELTEEKPGLQLEIETSTGLRINNIEYYRDEIDSLGAEGFIQSRNIQFNPVMGWIIKRTIQKYQANNYEEISINHERNAALLLYLLIPLFAFFMKVFRWKKSFTEHITFTLYFFSGFYIIMIITKVIGLMLYRGFSFTWLGLLPIPYIWVLIYLITGIRKNYEFNWISSSLIGIISGVLLLISMALLLFISSLLILPL